MNVNVGERVELGREPNFPGFTLPDRGGLERIKWLSVAQLVEVLVPASQERLPATRHTARLLRAIELPHLR